jgi:hypothetical protein
MRMTHALVSPDSPIRPPSLHGMRTHAARRGVSSSLRDCGLFT